MRSPTLLILAFGLLGLGLLSIGVYRDNWWPISGGITALAAAAWLFTEPRQA